MRCHLAASLSVTDAQIDEQKHWLLGIWHGTNNIIIENAVDE